MDLTLGREGHMNKLALLAAIFFAFACGRSADASTLYDFRFSGYGAGIVATGRCVFAAGISGAVFPGLA
jgi:hypothetical protein